MEIRRKRRFWLDSCRTRMFTPMTSMNDRLNAALDGRYRIERELGAGGMATVYLADDLKHDRKIALKVLRPELAAVIGGERFLAEIRTTANLQHPHILPLFDSGQDDGLLWYAMPYVEGESLRDRLDRAGQLPVDDVVDLGVAVASALDYAHRQGVVHRDIKPANILLQDGQPVVADFGIALAVSNAGGGRMTETGLSLGTPFYMSPEQASADRELTAQADQYSLGCVLYECLTGQPPFMGKSAQAVLMQILTDEPKSVTTFRKSVPTNVAAAVRTSLEKLPADRFRTAADLAAALRNPGYGVQTVATPGAVAAGSRRPGPARFVWPAAVAVAALAAAVGWTRTPSAPVQPTLRFEIGLAAPIFEVLGTPGVMSLRPDGGALAYIGDGDRGLANLYLQDFGTYDTNRLFDEGQINAVAFSPDGRSLLALNGGELLVLPVGGSPRRIADEVFAPTWDRDGTIYYTKAGAGTSLIRREGPDAEPEVLYTPSDDEDFLAGASEVGAGRYIVVDAVPRRAGTNGESVVFDTEERTIVRRLGMLSAVVVGGDILVWAGEDRMWAQRIDPVTAELVGSSVQTPDTPDARYGVFTVSESGTLVYPQPEIVSENVVRIAKDGTRQNVPVTVETSLGLNLSPDGTRLVFEEGFLGGQPDVHVLDLRSGVKTRLTYTGDAVYPVWHPDGERVAYYRNSGSGYALFTRNADGSGAEQLLFDDPELNEVEVAFIPGTDRIVVRGGDRSGLVVTFLREYSLSDPTNPIDIEVGRGASLAPAISPDGRFVAFGSAETGEWEIYVRSLENRDERWQVSFQGGSEPNWHPDGTELFYRRGQDLVSVPVDISQSWRPTGPQRVLFGVQGLLSNNNHQSYSVAPDGESFYFIRTGEGRTRIVLNWLDEVKRMLDAQPR